jgi:hypothetical protein
MEAEREWPRPVDAELVHLLLLGPVFTAIVAFHWPVTDRRLRDTATVLAAGLVALANPAPGGRSPGRPRR